LNISTGSIIKFFLVVLGLVLVYFIIDILASLFFAIIIASALEPGINWMQSRKVPRILSVILIFIAAFMFLIFFVYLVFPFFVDEFRSIANTYPSIQRQLLSGLEKFSGFSVVSDLRTNVQNVLGAPVEYLSQLSSSFSGFALEVFGGLLSFIFMVVFSFYLSAQEKGIESFLRLITPLAYEPYVINLWSRSQQKLGKWMQAQILLATIVGVFTFFGLTFLGVDNALFFALIAALFEIIPVAGPILAAVPAVIAAFFISPWTGVSVLILYALVQQAESHVIVPVVMRKTVGLSPLIVLLALLIGGKIGGIFGIILAVPITAILAELLEDWDKKKRSLLPGS